MSTTTNSSKIPSRTNHEIRTLGSGFPKLVVGRRHSRVTLTYGDTEIRLSLEQADRLSAAIFLEKSRAEREASSWTSRTEAPR